MPRSGEVHRGMYVHAAKSGSVFADMKGIGAATLPYLPFDSKDMTCYSSYVGFVERIPQDGS